MATPELMTTLQVTAVFSPRPRLAIEKVLQLDHGSTVYDALALLSHVCAAEFSGSHNGVGIWGVKVDASHVLHSGDRLEIYRPLTVDPKVARRLRFKGQGAKSKSAGLFATRRKGAKAGY